MSYMHKNKVRGHHARSRHQPIEQLRAAGIDMEDKNSINKALDVFKGLVDELEKEKVNKYGCKA